MNSALFILLVLSPAVLPVVVEAILIRLKPAWFAWLAFGSLGEHTFDVPNTKAALPALPAEIEYADIRLMSQGSLVMMQQRLSEQSMRTPGFVLIRIDVRRDGDTITLRARHVLAPLSLGLAVFIFCAMCATNPANLIGAIVLVLLVSVTVAVNFTFNAPRKPPHKRAFRRLEREYRRLLEEPHAEVAVRSQEESHA